MKKRVASGSGTYENREGRKDQLRVAAALSSVDLSTNLSNISVTFVRLVRCNTQTVRLHNARTCSDVLIATSASCCAYVQTQGSKRILPFFVGGTKRKFRDSRQAAAAAAEAAAATQRRRRGNTTRANFDSFQFALALALAR